MISTNYRLYILTPLDLRKEELSVVLGGMVGHGSVLVHRTSLPIIMPPGEFFLFVPGSRMSGCKFLISDATTEHFKDSLLVVRMI